MSATPHMPPTESGGGQGSPLRLALRLAVVAAVAWLGWRFLRGVDWRPVLEGVRHAEPVHLLLVVLLCVALAPLKAWRTRLLLAPFGRIAIGELCEWYLASWAADNVLMSQAGLGLRVALIRARGVPLVTAAAEQGLEKVLEGGTLLLLLPLLPAALLPASVRAALSHPLALLGGGVALAALLVGLLRLTRRRPELSHLLAAGAELRSPRVALLVMALSMAMWATEVVMVILTLQALGLPALLDASVLVVVVVNFAAVVPGLPGNLGTFEAAATAALAATGIAAGPALSAMVLYHALHTLPVTLLGAATLRRLRVTAAATVDGTAR